MAYDLLLTRIKERLEITHLSERKACIRADVNLGSVQRIRHGHAPRPETIVSLAKALGVPPAYLLEASVDGSKQPDLQPVFAMDTVYVRGAVQAGLWRAAVEWEPADWYSVQVPASRKYPGLQRFGLEVRGTSMNRHYREGAVVLTIKFIDLERDPVNGDHVVVHRRDGTTADFEATLKEYELDAAGRHILWPRSTDPEHQAPIILGEGDLEMSEAETPPFSVTAGHVDFAGVDDVLVSALVVGLYQEL